MGNQKSLPVIGISDSIPNQTDANVSLKSNKNNMKDSIKSPSKTLKTSEQKIRVKTKSNLVRKKLFAPANHPSNSDVKIIDKNILEPNNMFHLVEARENLKKKSNEIMNQIKSTSISRKYFRNQLFASAKKGKLSNTDSIDSSNETNMKELIINESEYTSISEINDDQRNTKINNKAKHGLSHAQSEDDYGFFKPTIIQDKKENEKTKKSTNDIDSFKGIINNQSIQSSLYSKVVIKRNFFSSVFALFTDQQQNTGKTKSSILKICKLFAGNQTPQNCQADCKQHQVNNKRNENCVNLNENQNVQMVVLELPAKRFNPIEEFLSTNHFSTNKEPNYESLTKYMSRSVLKSNFDRHSSSTSALSSSCKSDFYESLTTQNIDSQPVDKINNQKLIKQYSSDENNYIKFIRKEKVTESNSCLSDNVNGGDYQSLREYEQIAVTNYYSNLDKSNLKNKDIANNKTAQIPPPIPLSSLPNKNKLNEQLNYSLF
jgi:hypothetical protein